MNNEQNRLPLAHPMIPADHISFNDDGTAWLVTAAQPHSCLGCGRTLLDQTGCPGRTMHVAHITRPLDRPCDACAGTAANLLDELDDDHSFFKSEPCPDCVDGRHAFTIEVECDGPVHRSDRPCLNGCAYGALTYRVSVIPGMVLPVYGEDPGDWPDMLTADKLCVIIKNDGTAVLWDGAGDFTSLTLPPAAAPRMDAVKLKVAQRFEP